MSLKLTVHQKVTEFGENKLSPENTDKAVDVMVYWLSEEGTDPDDILDMNLDEIIAQLDILGEMGYEDDQELVFGLLGQEENDYEEEAY